MPTPVVTDLSRDDLAELVRAKRLLEQVSLAARVSNYIGEPIDKLIRALPAKSSQLILDASEKAIQASLRVALLTLRDKPRSASNTLHKIGAATSGAAGGVFGLPALAIELPLSTTIMLRSIADIARHQGEDLKTIDSQLACVEVFALGGPTRSDDAAEGGYYAVRAGLAKIVSDAASYLAGSTAASESAPLLVRLVAQIAARFSIPVTTKAAAQVVPIVGGIGGAVVNTLFIDHFQDIATGHFLVRSLERSYGKQVIKEEYDRIDIDAWHSDT
ncbi:MAG: EcsC family protein [Woeseia sp.]